jgi:hypothetical protein
VGTLAAGPGAVEPIPAGESVEVDPAEKGER